MENFSENALKQNQKKISVSKVASQLGVSSITVYNCCGDLHIRRFKRGLNTFIKVEDLQLVADLVAYLKENGKHKKSVFINECIANGRIIPSVKRTKQNGAVMKEIDESTSTKLPQEETPGEGTMFVSEAASVTQQQQELATTNVQKVEIDIEPSRVEKLVTLQAKKGEQVQATDIQEVNERAQRRAFCKAAAEETLTLIYEATEEFTIPGLKEELRHHRETCNQARGSRGAAHNVNDFLAKAIKLAAPNL